MTKYSQTIVKPERIAKLVDETAVLLRPAVKEESEAKLARFDKVVAGETPAGGGGFGGLNPPRAARTRGSGGPNGGIQK